MLVIHHNRTSVIVRFGLLSESRQIIKKKKGNCHPPPLHRQKWKDEKFNPRKKQRYGFLFYWNSTAVLFLSVSILYVLLISMKVLFGGVNNMFWAPLVATPIEGLECTWNRQVGKRVEVLNVFLGGKMRIMYCRMNLYHFIFDLLFWAGGYLWFSPEGIMNNIAL